ncbi:hypothetical protein DL95DRAFT_414592 [Leptodontidium sp. 2 PMI_412]|nr:hypothetical protein BKA61DRAFT_574473 [Leptodontidium sp. MPI-SDFR-AT-0119]KAH9208641.1 hypothetical protein DL95DRAFT_414592 [Leptodontidium sp. 2 PMI_412]
MGMTKIQPQENDSNINPIREYRVKLSFPENLRHEAGPINAIDAIESPTRREGPFGPVYAEFRSTKSTTDILAEAITKLGLVFLARLFGFVGIICGESTGLT